MAGRTRGPPFARAGPRLRRDRPGRGDRPSLPRDGQCRGAQGGLPRHVLAHHGGSALVDERHALLALARRPRDAPGHGDEEVRAALLQDGELHPVETARISTVYDAGGRQRSAGLELWLEGEEYPRRGSGLVIAGSSMDLDAVQVHAAIFRWRLDGRDATGAYELMVRTEPPAAA